MKNNYDYDEYQKYNRYKYGYRSFILLMVLVLIAGIYQNMGGSLGDPFATSMALVTISGCFFVVPIILRGSYLAKGKKTSYWMIGAFFLLAFLNFLLVGTEYRRFGKAYFWDHGLSFRVVPCFSGVIFLVIAVSLWIYRRKEKKEG